MPNRINPIALYLLSLGATIAAYACYAQYAVPVIEGPPNLIKPQVARQVESVDQTAATIEKIAWLFPADAWELAKGCKVVKSPQGIILFRDYQRLDGGMIDVFPFTMILNEPETESDSSAPAKPPTVLRAMEGARLQFDKPLTLGSEGGGKLEQAQLAGQVVIYRPPSANAGNDSLNILTSNVQINAQRVFTLDDVDFQFGLNRGNGRGLMIDLESSDVPDASGLSGIEGFRRIELTSLKQMRLESSLPEQNDNGNVLATPHPENNDGRPDQDSQLFATGGAPIDITCSGPFVFDVTSSTAVLNGNVTVSRDDAFGDNLTCERLTLVFQKAGDPPDLQSTARKPENAVPSPTDNLQLRRMIAVGTPARLNAISRQSELVGDRIDYNLTTGHVDVEGQKGVLLTSPEYRFVARSFKYVIPDDGSIGPLDATGPGQMTGNARANQPNARPFEARWLTTLTIRPADDGQTVIQMDGGTRIKLDAVTQIASDHLKFWMWQVPKRDPETGRPTEGTDYVPSRLFTEGNVNIESPQLSGTARQLVAKWPLPTEGQPANQTGAMSVQPFYSEQHSALESQQAPVTAPGTHAVMPLENSLAPETNQSPNAINSPDSADGGTSIDERFPENRSFEQQQFQQQPRQEQPPSVSGNRFSSQRPPYQSGNQSTDFATPRTRLGPPRQETTADWASGSSANATANFTQTGFVEPLARQATGNTGRQQQQAGPGRKFKFDGDLVNVSLGDFAAGSPVVDLQIEGNVLVNEIRAAGSGDPLRISGNRLQMTPQAGELFLLTVTGSQQDNAIVDSGQLRLAGPSVMLDQQANRIRVEGPGEMSLQGMSAENGAKAGSSIDVAWKGSMDFNGRKIHIEREVVMASKENTLDGGVRQTNSRGEYLDVTLKRAVSLQQAEDRTGGAQAEFENIVLTNRPPNGTVSLVSSGAASVEPEPVVIDNRTFDDRGQLQEHLQFIVPSATVAEGGNTVTAHGPGTIINRSLGSSSMAITAPGVTANQPQNGSGAEGITYVHINFDGPFFGNIPENKFRIERNVRTMYARADNWEQLINPDVTTRLPEGAVKMMCDQITVDRWQKRDQSEPTNELHATGNAHIVSSTFEVTADRVNYAEDNDMMIIEGTPRSPATLRYTPVPGGSPKNIVAEKIQYRPSDEWTHIQGIKNGNFTSDR